MAELSDEVIRYVTGEYDVEVVRRLFVPKGGLRRISGLERCSQLVCLALPQNEISVIEGLCELVQLQRLDLSRNVILRLGGLDTLAALEFLDLQGNRIAKVEEIKSLQHNQRLAHLHLKGYDGKHKNACCDDAGYEALVLQTLPDLQVLDGERLSLRAERRKLDALFAGIRPDPSVDQPLPTRDWLDDDPKLAEPAGPADGALRKEFAMVAESCGSLSTYIDAQVAECRTCMAELGLELRVPASAYG